MNVIAPLLITLAGIAILSGAETEHDDHAGHDHGTAPAATAPAKKKPHVHGAHGEEEGEDEHGHDEPGHTEGSGEVSLSAAAAARFGIVSEPAKARAVAAVIRAPGWIVYDPAGQAQIATPAAFS